MAAGKLYGVGIGPGDPGLVTLRAAEILRGADVVFTVASANRTHSVSRAIVESLGPLRGEARTLSFSMSRDAAVRTACVEANAKAIADELKAGRDCAFATLGDAMTYSTFGYVLPLIRRALPGVEVVCGAVCDAQSLEPFFANPDDRDLIVIHAAGVVSKLEVIAVGFLHTIRVLYGYDG